MKIITQEFMRISKFLCSFILAGFSIASTSCITKRTVTDDQGVVVDESYVIHRPVKEFVENVEVEE